MKAVDPAVEVSVITSEILPAAMTPKPDPHPSSRLNSPAKHPADSPKHPNNSPVRDHYLNSTLNGLDRGDSETGCKNDTMKNSTANGVHPMNGIKNGTTNGILNGMTNGVQNGMNGIHKGVVIQCRSPKREERYEPFVNGVVNNGFDRGDEEKHSLESLAEPEPEHEVDGRGRSRSPPEDIPGLAVDSGLESAASSWDRTVAEAKEHAVGRLQEELRRAREELKLRDEEVGRLSRIRAEVEAELEELTASLFQEAHNMVRVANERQAAAEKALRESTMQVEVLTAEVAALKTLVLTSTPSKPNPHLHPQIDPKAKDDSANTGNQLFRKHRRSPSHFNLKYGRENSPPESPTKDPRPSSPSTELAENKDGLEVDPVLHREFLAWRQSPTLDQDSSEFVARVYREDIDCCLAFSNAELAEEVRRAVQSGTVFIEAVNDKARTHFPKRCALLEAPRQCQYRMRLGEADTWHCISQICRNRIIAVCDFLNYLNYIQRGLVKSSAWEQCSHQDGIRVLPCRRELVNLIFAITVLPIHCVHDIYWEIIRLRKEMVLARLGLPLTV